MPRDPNFTRSSEPTPEEDPIYLPCPDCQAPLHVQLVDILRDNEIVICETCGFQIRPELLQPELRARAMKPKIDIIEPKKKKSKSTKGGLVPRIVDRPHRLTLGERLKKMWERFMERMDVLRKKLEDMMERVMKPFLPPKREPKDFSRLKARNVYEYHPSTVNQQQIPSKTQAFYSSKQITQESPQYTSAQNLPFPMEGYGAKTTEGEEKVKTPVRAPDQPFPISDEDEKPLFDVTTGAPLNAAARRLRNKKRVPRFDSVTGAPLTPIPEDQPTTIEAGQTEEPIEELEFPDEEFSILEPAIHDQFEKLPFSEEQKDMISKALVYLTPEQQARYLDEFVNINLDIEEEEQDLIAMIQHMPIPEDQRKELIGELTYLTQNNRQDFVDSIGQGTPAPQPTASPQREETKPHEDKEDEDEDDLSAKIQKLKETLAESDEPAEEEPKTEKTKSPPKRKQITD